MWLHVAEFRPQKAIAWAFLGLVGVIMVTEVSVTTVDARWIFNGEDHSQIPMDSQVALE
jgi:hypothetical protein